MKEPVLGTHWDTSPSTIAVLIRAGKRQLADGMAFNDLSHAPTRVVIVKDDNLAGDVRALDKNAWERIIGILQLRHAHDNGDELAARNAIRKIFGISEKDLAQTIKYQESAHILSAVEFTKAMKSAKFILWLRLLPERLEPGILCDDLPTALFVRGALRDLRTCACCDTVFQPERPDQQYCSIRCRERFRKRRLRAKSKQKRRSR